MIHKREYDRVGKFDSWVDKGILVGYSRKRKGIKMLQTKTQKDSGNHKCKCWWKKCVKDQIRKKNF